MVFRFPPAINRLAAPLTLASVAGATFSQEAELTAYTSMAVLDFDGGTAVFGHGGASVGMDQTTPAMAFQPGTNLLFTVDNGGLFPSRLVVLDAATLEEETIVGPLGFDFVHALAFHPTGGTLYGADPSVDELIVIDPATGAAQSVGPLGFTGVRGLTFDPVTHVLYGCDNATNQLIVVDPATGAGTPVGPVGFSSVRDLAFDSSSGVLYGVDWDADVLLTIDPATGAGTAVGPLGFTEVEGLAFDPIGQTLYGSDLATNGLLSFEMSTGAGSFLGSFPPYLNPGVAWVFERHPGGTWSQVTRLVASDWEDSDGFGTAGAISGNTIAVGAPGDDSGSVYVFERDLGGPDAWGESVKIQAIDHRLLPTQFGRSVALSGDTLVVSAEDDSLDAGMVFFYERNEGGPGAWGQTQLLVQQGNQHLGNPVALHGDTAVLSGRSIGEAYVLERDAVVRGLWTQTAKLSPPETQLNNGWFASSVAVWGDTVLVGAPLWQLHLLYSGAVFVFERDEGGPGAWGQTAMVKPLDPVQRANFGRAVDVEEDIALVGAPGFFDAFLYVPGSAYVFESTAVGWAQKAKLKVLGSTSFGYAVGLSQGIALVAGGDPIETGTIQGPGPVYAFVAISPESYCTAGTSASGCVASISASGTASASAPSGFDLMASSVEGQKDGLFFFGTNGQQANPWGNGTSYQCVVPPIVRTPIMTGTGTTSHCDGSFALDLNALWCPTCPKPTKNPGAAAVVRAQLWYRDPASTSNQTTSLSDAIEFGVGP